MGEYAIYILIIELIFFIALIGVGVWIYRRRALFIRESKEITRTILPDQDVSIQELINRAKREHPKKPLNIVLGSGNFVMDDDLLIEKAVRLYGEGIEKTTLLAKGDNPAITFRNAKDCKLSNMKIEGSVLCTNGAVFIKNCHVIAQDDGICIEALEGSMVTFSGMIRAEGGIAIRATGESQVILKPPYALSGDDYIVVDPKSKVTIEDQLKDK